MPHAALPYEPPSDREDLQASVAALRGDGASVTYWTCVLIHYDEERQWLGAGASVDVAFERAVVAKDTASG
jgi:hypothetical protein